MPIRDGFGWSAAAWTAGLGSRHYAWVSTVEERPLSEKERGVLEVLLGASFPGVEELRQQVPTLVVSGICGCGCPTIYFGHSDKGQGVEVIAEADVAGTQDSILLFISEGGRLDSMEYVWLGEVPPGEFPTPEQVDVRERS